MPDNRVSEGGGGRAKRTIISAKSALAKTGERGVPPVTASGFGGLRALWSPDDCLAQTGVAQHRVLQELDLFAKFFQFRKNKGKSG